LLPLRKQNRSLSVEARCEKLLLLLISFIEFDAGSWVEIPMQKSKKVNKTFEERML
jgi:hypothetical protein